jgi:hypothetical protein
MHRINWRISCCGIMFCIRGLKTEPQDHEILLKPMKNLSHHTDLLCDLVTSLLIKGIQMREMSKLVWLLGLVKYSYIIRANIFYFLYLVLLSISKILASS